jgi:acetyltransferase-like isoleucine patch superfamily enzyme
MDSALNAMRKVFIVYSNSNVRLSYGVYVSVGAKILSTDGGSVNIGENVFIGPYCNIICRGGTIVIGDNVHIGDGCIIASTIEIAIGRDTQIAEYVVIRDQDHRIDGRPIRLSGFDSNPIRIGKDCWLGTKSSVLKGSVIGDGSLIGAHGLVRGEIPAFTLAVGCPARVIREL